METTEAQELTAYELERGKPMPNLTHGALQMNLGFEIKLHYGSIYRIASEVALATLPDGSTPDLVVYPQTELNFVNEVAKQTAAPLLTVEIQSPSQTTDDMIEKAGKYFAFGVKSSWIVFPAMKAIAVYTSPGNYLFFHDTDTLKDPVLNLEIDLQKIFI
ncbi:MAG: Uma2 family endonuclease [Verrucomicrobia bacterium]|nr:Uma2 family endonuclease [Cytophagales bacterium]